MLFLKKQKIFCFRLNQFEDDILRQYNLEELESSDANPNLNSECSTTDESGTEGDREDNDDFSDSLYITAFWSIYRQRAVMSVNSLWYNIINYSLGNG